jgi:homoaconitase
MANMGAEVGATTTIFPYTSNMRSYLEATGRSTVAAAADNAASRGFLAADEGAEYDDVIEIVGVPPRTDFYNCLFWPAQDLSKLEPTINGPFTPDLSTPLSKFGQFVNGNGWKDEFSAALIGSCTNSSYEDMVGDFDTEFHAEISNSFLDSGCRTREASEGSWTNFQGKAQIISAQSVLM